MEDLVQSQFNERAKNCLSSDEPTDDALVKEKWLMMAKAWKKLSDSLKSDRDNVHLLM